MLISYLPILILLAIVSAFVVGTIAITRVLGPSRVNDTKMAAFECGVPSQGDSRHPMSIGYFRVAILFVLFDVEVIFFYPWAVNFKQLGVTGFVGMLMFSVAIFAGFFFVLKNKILDFGLDD